MNTAIFVLLFIVGLINFLPVIGILSAERLSSAYSIGLASHDLVILMRHRALLFGLIGGFMLFSLFKPTYQTPAMVMAGISMVGFLYFVWAADGNNASIAKIMLIDILGIICLLLAVLFKYLNTRT